MMQMVKLTNQITMRLLILDQPGIQMTMDLKLLLTKIIQVLEVEEDFKQNKTQAQILVSYPTCHSGRGVTMATQQPFVGAATPEKLDSRY